MSTHVKILYPSRDTLDGDQHTNDDEIPFGVGAALLTAIVAHLPEDERALARIQGWKSLRLVTDHTDTQAEVEALRAAVLAEMFATVTQDGLSKAALDSYQQKLAAL